MSRLRVPSGNLALAVYAVIGALVLGAFLYMGSVDKDWEQVGRDGAEWVRSLFGG